MAVTDDLMDKIAADVKGAMRRTLALVDEPLPVAMSGAGAAIGTLCAVLERMGSEPPGDTPDPDCLLLAGLMAARIGQRHDDPIGQAYRDLAALTGKDD